MSFMNIRLSIPLFMSIRIRNNERKSSAGRAWKSLSSTLALPSGVMRLPLRK